MAFSWLTLLSALHYGIGEVPIVEDNQVLYHFRSRQHPEGLTLNQTNLDLIDPSKPTKFVIAGWIYGINDTMYTLLNSEYLKYQDCNVVDVDWTKYSFNMLYTASSAVFPVGKLIVEQHPLVASNTENTYLQVLLSVGFCLN